MFGRRKDSDFQAEIESHIRLETDRLIADGMLPSDARNAARRMFGNATAATERFHDSTRFALFEQLRQDLSYGLRNLRKTPGFTFVAVLSLALGIGVNLAAFGLLDALLIRHLPIRNPEQLRIVRWVQTDHVPVRSQSGYSEDEEGTGARVSSSFSYPIYRMFSEQVRQLSDVIGFADEELTLTSNGQSEFANGQFVSGNYFTGLGANALLGRTLVPDDDKPDKPLAVVITYKMWERRFGLDPSVLGREVTINKTRAAIIGVMPRQFQGLVPGRGTVDVFVPFSMLAVDPTPWYSLSQQDNWWVQVFARVPPGVSDVAASDALHTTLAHVIASYAGSTAGAVVPRLSLAPGARGVGLLRRSFERPMLVLTGAVGIVMLIACVNLANLLLARSAARQRELAVRLSVGASRARLVRQLLTESLLLSALGTALGIFVSSPVRAFILRQIGGMNALSLDVRTDYRSLAFAASLAIVTGLLFGILPALRATRLDLTPTLKPSGAASWRGPAHTTSTQILIAAQVALSLVLLVGAGLFLRTLYNLNAIDLGFQAESILTFKTDPSRSGHKEADLVALYSRLQDKLATIPGVLAVGSSHLGLLVGHTSNDNFFVPGTPPNDRRQMNILRCSNTFLSAMRIPIIRGRDLAPGDSANAALVAVVNEKLAKEYFPNQDPVGQSFYLGGRPAAGDRPIQIVGVSKDAHYSGVREEIPAIGYFPHAQWQKNLGGVTFILRTAVPPASISSAVRRAAAEVDPAIPVAQLATQVERATESIGRERLFAGIVTGVGVLALLLAAIGLYGVMAFTVTRRTAEIGIRLALGARRTAVVWLVVRNALATVLVGVVVGVPVAYALTNVTTKLLYGVKPDDPFNFVAAVAILGAIAAFSAWLPARRAARIDPNIALRCD